MTKNITVVDELGNVYAQAWPRRAKGLVKKGRARFVNESVICLACPPFQMEDDRMDTLKINKQLNQAEQQKANDSKETNPPAQLDVSYLMLKIDQIIADSGYLATALQQLENLEGASAMAVSNMIEYRERTNQRMIDLLEKLMEKLAI